jgi:hypothetical protein
MEVRERSQGSCSRQVDGQAEVIQPVALMVLAIVFRHPVAGRNNLKA